MLDDSADGPMHTRRPGWRQSGIYQPVGACSLHVCCSCASSVAGHAPAECTCCVAAGSANDNCSSVLATLYSCQQHDFHCCQRCIAQKAALPVHNWFAAAMLTCRPGFSDIPATRSQSCLPACSASTSTSWTPQPSSGTGITTSCQSFHRTCPRRIWQTWCRSISPHRSAPMPPLPGDLKPALRCWPVVPSLRHVWRSALEGFLAAICRQHRPC